MTQTASSAWSMDEALRQAIERLGADGFVAYPTETVWGLGACADRPQAIERLMAWKQRAAQTPLAVLVPGPEMAEAIGCELRAPVRRLMDAFWPGPLMIVVACRETWAPGVARSDGALGLRCSSNPLASALSQGLLDAGLGPLTSTSLNRSGERPARDLSQATRITELSLGESDSRSFEVPLVICATGGDAGGGQPSTVVDCTDNKFSILRDGAIARESIEEVWRG